MRTHAHTYIHICIKAADSFCFSHKLAYIRIYIHTYIPVSKRLIPSAFQCYIFASSSSFFPDAPGTHAVCMFMCKYVCMHVYMYVCEYMLYFCLLIIFLPRCPRYTRCMHACMYVCKYVLYFRLLVIFLPRCPRYTRCVYVYV